ncbi:unnamed protein product [Vitrella brassicaformis CCMP3155]|uniref:Exostosin GT47 domain-containing protein n=2 Tax=Vitrella brassicaformis TaxID=1169539 RepID=A0A0G4GU55_VITBC|nr:unnamed protein product [Vitrella brassicaformis CCMP3155]|eukprot:CEM34303.1 unnamed protein product [Vitrella brassicaformis CCMP3155]
MADTIKSEGKDVLQGADAKFANLEAVERDIEVPFYVYQTPAMRQLYDMCQKAARHMLTGHWPGRFDLDNRKNVDEIYWLDQLWKDTWRTFDPDKALVYVLPIYPVLLYHRSCKEGNRKKIHALADKAVKEVMETPQWERNRGLDHILVLTDFEFKYPGRMEMVFGRAFSTFARNITQGRHLADNHRDLFGCAVTIPHTSSLTALQKAYQPFEKESLLKRGLIKPTDVFEDDRLGSAFDPPSRHDWFQRDYTMFFQGRTDFGRPYRNLAFEHLAGWHGPNPAKSVFVMAGNKHKTKLSLPDCPRQENTTRSRDMPIGRFERCKIARKKHKDWLLETSTFMHRLANSKLNLCFRGTDVTSSRVMDGFWARTLNVLINEVDDAFKYGIPFQCEIPWRNFTYAIEGSVFEQDPRAALKPILDELYKDHRAVTKKLRLMDYYSKKILWNAPKSETARSVLRAMTRQCLTDEAKVGFIKRTTKDGTAANVRDHPLFSRCAFVDTSAKGEEQRNPCATCDRLHI